MYGVLALAAWQPPTVCSVEVLYRQDQCNALQCFVCPWRLEIRYLPCRHRHPCTYSAASGRYCYMLCGPLSRHSRSTATSSHLERSSYRQYKVSATREQTPLVLVPGTKPPSLSCFPPSAGLLEQCEVPGTDWLSARRVRSSVGRTVLQLFSMLISPLPSFGLTSHLIPQRSPALSRSSQVAVGISLHISLR